MRLPTLTFPKIDAATLRENAPSVVTGILVLALTVTGVQLGRSAIGWWQQTQTKGPATLPTVTAAATPGFDASAIANAHLFGGGEMANAPTDAEPPALFLAGTIAFDDPASGFAILGESTDTARFRAVGSEISPGLLLKAVFRDRVLVGQGDSSFAIRLPSKLAAGMASLYSSLPTGGDGQLVGNVFAFTPTYDEKTLVGVKITPGLDTATFQALGLRAGDSIAEFAHQNITDPAESLWSLANIQPGEEIEITVMRNGGYIDMTVNGTQVTKKRNQILSQPSAKPVSSK